MVKLKLKMSTPARLSVPASPRGGHRLQTLLRRRVPFAAATSTGHCRLHYPRLGLRLLCRFLQGLFALVSESTNNTLRGCRRTHEGSEGGPKRLWSDGHFAECMKICVRLKVEIVYLRVVVAMLALQAMLRLVVM